MKLSFSTSERSEIKINSAFDLAKNLGYSGVELNMADYAELNNPTIINTFKRNILEYKVEVPLINAKCDLSEDISMDSKIDAIKSTIDFASKLNVKYVRIYAKSTDIEQSTFDDAIKAIIDSLLSYASSKNVVLLIETIGYYSDTNKLVELLDFFSSDNLGVLWDCVYPFALHGEKPSESIKRLGAYVKHIHVKDFTVNKQGEIKYCLMGEGELPFNDIFDALRSLNYEGFISYELKNEWYDEIGDFDIIAAQFVTYISKFNFFASAKRKLYNNKSNTGKFIWEKEELITKTFSEVLDAVVEEFPDQYAVKYTTLNYTKTYSEFRDDVDNFARALIALGVKKGGHVSIWATNVPQWFVVFWAVTKIGAVLVSMNTAYKVHEAEYILRQSDTHTVIIEDGFRDSDYIGIIKELCPELATVKKGEQLHSKRLPFLRNVITLKTKIDGSYSWEEAYSMKNKVPYEELRRRSSQVRCDDVCNIQYTSGTTGFPKGVMLTHYNVINNGKCIGDRMDLSTADRMMIQVPMFHCFGMVLSMTASMTHATTVYPLPYFAPKPALACVNQEKITCFHGVPTMFISMLEHEDFGKTDFSYARTGIMAGSPCPIKVMQDVIDKMNMSEIVIVYGQTEASPGCTMSHTNDSVEVRVETVGSALSKIECKIIDPETGLDAPDGTTGEFVARGYNVMKGYYKMPNETKQVIDEDGWLHTGDLALKTSEGNYKITGRLKDMIIRGGENIYPKEIEEFVYTHPKVKDVQVVGVPDEQMGEEIMAYIITKENETLDEDEIKAYIRANMARHKLPRYVEFIDEFPMNAAGKILKFKLRDIAIEKYKL